MELTEACLERCWVLCPVGYPLPPTSIGIILAAGECSLSASRNTQEEVAHCSEYGAATTVTDVN